MATAVIYLLFNVSIVLLPMILRYLNIRLLQIRKTYICILIISPVLIGFENHICKALERYFERNVLKILTEPGAH